MQFLTGSVWLYILTETENFLRLSQKSFSTSSDQLLQLLFLFTYLYPPKVTSDPPPLHDFLWLWKEVFICLLLLTAWTLFPLLGARDALSVLIPAFLTSWPVCASSPSLCTQSFYSLVIALWFFVHPTSNDGCGLWGKRRIWIVQQRESSKDGSDLEYY